MHGHFRSRDKDGGHTIRSAKAENLMLHTPKLYGSVFYRTGVNIRSKFYIAAMGIVDHFCSCDLDLGPMISIYKVIV